MKPTFLRLFVVICCVALLGPLGGILFQTRELLKVNQKLLVQKVSEHQRETVEELEWFYKKRMLDTYMAAVPSLVASLPFDFQKDPEAFKQVYWKEFFPLAGLPVPASKEEESKAFIRLEMIRLVWNSSYGSIFELLNNSLKNTSVSSPSDHWLSLLSELNTNPATDLFQRIHREFNVQQNIDRDHRLDPDLTHYRYSLSGQERSMFALREVSGWALYQGFMDPIVRFLLFDSMGLAIDKVERLTSLGVTLKEIVHVPEQLLSISGLGGDSGIIWTRLPRNPDTEKYKKEVADYFMGKGPVPKAIVFILIHRDGLLPAFTRAFNQMKIPDNMQKADQRLKDLYLEMKTRFQSKKEKIDFLTFAPSLGLYFAGMPESWTKLQKKQWKNMSRIQFYSIDRDKSNPDLAQILPAGFDIKKLANLPNHTLDFRFRQNGEKFLGTLVEKKSMPGQLVLLQIPEAVAFEESRWLVLISSTLICSCFLLILILIFYLRVSVIQRLEKLTHRVLGFKESLKHIEWPEAIRGNDSLNEIERMESGFEKIRFGIRSRLYELETIANLQKNQHEDKSQALTELLRRLLAGDKKALFICFFVGQTRQVAGSAGVYSSGQEMDLQSLDKLSAQCYPCLKNKDLIIPLEGEELKAEILEGEAIVLVFLAPVLKTGSLLRRGVLQQALSLMNRIHLDSVKAENVEGKDIQMKMMPTEDKAEGLFKLSSFFEAAHYLGGDFMDIQSLSDGRLALIVADVSGKGIGPSLFGASVKASLQVFLHQGLEPGSVLHKTNQFILQGKDNQLFATIFLAILDPLSGQFVYASAGHNRMFQFHLERDIEDLSAKGLPLGIFEGAAYESKTGFIEPGGGLVLYTDGITELVNPQLDLYSLPRLRQFVGQNFHLEPAIFKKSLLLDMDAFRQNCDLADDITCIVMQRSLESL